MNVVCACRGCENSLVSPHFTFKIIYNSLCFHAVLSWAVILIRTVMYTVDHAPSWAASGIPGALPGFYDNMRWLLQIFQTAAFLEVHTDPLHNTTLHSETSLSLADSPCGTGDGTVQPLHYCATGIT